MSELKTLARPYARAAFEYAEAGGRLTEWETALNLLCALAADPRVGVRLASPETSAPQRAELLLELAGDAADANVANFVRILAEQKRLNLLGSVAELFRAMKIERERTVDVEITSAFEVSAEQQALLEKTLARALNRQVILKSSIDPGLIGGVRINAGDTVIDASIRGRLAKLAEAMNS
jgi:F-type H+-transporting ATPase subunit delta